MKRTDLLPDLCALGYSAHMIQPAAVRALVAEVANHPKAEEHKYWTTYEWYVKGAISLPKSG